MSDVDAGGLVQLLAERVERLLGTPADVVEDVLIEFLVELLLGFLLPGALYRRDPLGQVEIVERRHGVIYDFPQRIWIKRGKRVDLGLLDAIAGPPACGPQLGLLQRSLKATLGF